MLLFNIPPRKTAHDISEHSNVPAFTAKRLKCQALTRALGQCFDLHSTMQTSLPLNTTKYSEDSPKGSSLRNPQKHSVEQSVTSPPV